MNIILTGILAGTAAAPAWIIINLFIDMLFLPIIRRHTDQLNAVLLARPGLNLLVLSVDILAWGAVFGAIYGLLYRGLEPFGVLGGVLWGVIMFVGFSRSIIEGGLWTKIPKDMNSFWFVEGLAGMAAWGWLFGVLFQRFHG